jgi:hypothetical protein
VVKVIDLAKLAQELPEGFEEVRRLIGRTLDLNSARTDLRIAADQAAQALSLLQEPVASEPYEDMMLALTSSAVIYYARATKSQSNHRRTFDIRSHFDDAERKGHEFLCKLRDDALAHYGPGELPEGAKLRSDHLLVSPDGKLVAISRHAFSTEQLSEMIFKQAQRASFIMQRLFHGEETRLVEALNQLALEPAAKPATRAARVEMGAAIGDEKVASQILAGPRVGARRVRPD